jgi:hypothetical protein
MEFDSLFVPADDDRQWDEMDEEEEPQDILGWDASGTQVCGFPFSLLVVMDGWLTKRTGRIRGIYSRCGAFLLET